MQYIAVGDGILRKFCGLDQICFWTPMALVNPAYTKDLFLFDCTLFRYVKDQFIDRIECRLLVSFKSPLSIEDIYYGGNLGYKELHPSTNCDKEDVESYIATLLQSMNKEIKDLRDALTDRQRKKLSSRVLSFLRREYSDLKAIYYGSLVKARIMMDMIERLGYRNNTLNANVRGSFVLVSLDPKRDEYRALVIDRDIKLGAYRSLLDKERLMDALGFD